MPQDHSILLEIWGRNIPIEVVYGCFPGQEPTSIQVDTYTAFMENKAAILDQAKTALISYVQAHYEEDIDELQPYEYLRPRALFLKRSVTGRRIAGLICTCQYDPENDLVAYIDNEQVTNAGTQDILL